MPSSSCTNTSGQWSRHRPSPVQRSWSIHTRMPSRGYRERRYPRPVLPDPPVAKRIPVTVPRARRRRRRRLRLAARPRRPRHPRLPQGRERLRRRLVRAARPACGRSCSTRSSGARRRPTCRCRCRKGAVALLRPHRGGPVVPGPLPARRHARRRRRRRAGPARRERRGRRARRTSPSAPSTSAPTTASLAWSTDVDGGEEYTLRFRDLGHRPRPARHGRAHLLRHGVVGRRPAPLLREARRRHAAVPGLAPRAGHAGGRRRARVRGARRAVLRRPRPDPQRGLRADHRVESKTTSEVWVVPADGAADARPAVIEPRRGRPRVHGRPPGRPLRDPHQRRRRGLPDRDGAGRRARPGALDRAGAARRRAAGSSASTPSPGTSCVHEWADGMPRLRVAVRRRHRAGAGLRRARPQRRAGRQRRVRHHRRALRATSRW